MESCWTVLRIVNVALYLAVLSGTIMHWNRLPPLPGFRWGLLVVVGGSAWMTVQAAFSDSPGGIRLAALTVGLSMIAWSFYARPITTWYHSRRRRHPRTT